MAEAVQGYNLDEASIRGLRNTKRTVEGNPVDLRGNDQSSPAHGKSGTPINWQLGGNGSGSDIPPYSCVAVGAVNQANLLYAFTLTQPAGTTGVQYGLT